MAALDHAAEPAHPVVVVHHVVAGREVVEEAAGLALARPGRAVGPPSAGEVGLASTASVHVGQHARRLRSGATTTWPPGAKTSVPAPRGW